MTCACGRLAVFLSHIFKLATYELALSTAPPSRPVQLRYSSDTSAQTIQAHTTLRPTFGLQQFQGNGAAARHALPRLRTNRRFLGALNKKLQLFNVQFRRVLLLEGKDTNFSPLSILGLKAVAVSPPPRETRDSEQCPVSTPQAGCDYRIVHL